MNRSCGRLSGPGKTCGMWFRCEIRESKCFCSELFRRPVVVFQSLLQRDRRVFGPRDNSINSRLVANEFLPSFVDVEICYRLFQEAPDHKRSRPSRDASWLLLIVVCKMNHSTCGKISLTTWRERTIGKKLK